MWCSASTHLVQKGWVSSPFEQRLHSLPVATLTGQMKWSKPTVVDAVNDTEGVQQSFDDVSVTVPGCFVQCSVSKLSIYKTTDLQMEIVARKYCN